MSRLIDGDALTQDIMNRYCKECNRRKGLKSGKYRILYEIGEVPCRACEMMDAMEEIDNAPTVDAVEVVRCKDCRYGHIDHCLGETCWICGLTGRVAIGDGYCHEGVKRDAAN